MGMTVFGGTLQRLLTCLHPTVLRLAAALAAICKLTARFFEGERRQSRPGSVLASLASLLGQGVFWQVHVLQTIVNQGHPD
jgi:hypothetical protein